MEISPTTTTTSILPQIYPIQESCLFSIANSSDTIDNTSSYDTHNIFHHNQPHKGSQKQ